MRIQDAKPGDVLRDKDGALWLVGKDGARCIYEPGVDLSGDEGGVEFGGVNHYGPFTRLVPEQETP